MRRIYDSDALHRDDEEPHAPRERRRETRPQSFRSIDASGLSRRLLPARLRHWAVTVDVSSPDREFAVDEPVPFDVELRNRLPVPVTIATTTPVPWTWSVDGAEEASRVSLREPPDDGGAFHFDRGERKRFRKEWPQRFRVSDSEWEVAGPGEYTVGAAVNVDDAAAKGLADETTVRIVEE